MHRSSIAAIALVSTVAFVQIASAADLPRKAPAYTPPPPVFSWTGFYVGGNVGGHWGKDEITAAADPIGFTAVGINLAAFDAVYATSLKPQSVIGGVQIGYNWQATPNIVFGVEADANWLGGTASRFLSGTPLTVIGLGAIDSFSNSTQATFLSTVRGRLGWAFDRSLLYVTGGLAVETIKTTDTFVSGGPFVGTTSNRTTRTGWTIGGGWEYAFAGNWTNWSVKAEYLYADLGTFDTVIPSNPLFLNTDVTVNHSYTENVARVGLNYRFGGRY